MIHSGAANHNQKDLNMDEYELYPKWLHESATIKRNPNAPYSIEDARAKHVVEQELKEADDE